MKIRDAIAAVDKEWKKSSRQSQYGNWKVKSKKEAILEAQRDKKNVHFATIMAHPECEVETQITKGQRQSRAPW